MTALLNNSFGNEAVFNIQAQLMHQGGINDDPPSLYNHRGSNQNVIRQLVDVLKRRGIHWNPDEKLEDVKVTRLKSKIETVRRFLTPEQKRFMKESFENDLRTLAYGASNHCTPVIIWEKNGAIHFVNQAFRETTGWKEQTPTQENWAIMETLSDSSLLEIHSVMNETLMNPEMKTMSLAIEFKRFDLEGEEFVTGSAIITVKRDVFGLPQLFCMHYVPLPKSVINLEVLLATKKITEETYLNEKAQRRKSRDNQREDIRIRLSEPLVDDLERARLNKQLLSLR